MALSEDRQVIADTIVDSMISGKLSWADYKKASTFLYDMNISNEEVMHQVQLLLLAANLRNS